MSDIRLQDGSTKRRADLKASDVVRLEGGEAIQAGTLLGSEETRLQGGETQRFANIS